MDLGKKRGEDVGVVVGWFVLQDGHKALEAYAGVDMFAGQGLERPVGLPVELDEDDVSMTLGSSWLTRSAALRPPTLS